MCELTWSTNESLKYIAIYAMKIWCMNYNKCEIWSTNDNKCVRGKRLKVINALKIKVNLRRGERMSGDINLIRLY